MRRRRLEKELFACAGFFFVILAAFQYFEPTPSMSYPEFLGCALGFGGLFYLVRITVAVETLVERSDSERGGMP